MTDKQLAIFRFVAAIFSAILIIILVFRVTAHAQQWGFYRAKEVITTGERTYRIVTGTKQVVVLDEEGIATGEMITRPITKEVTEPWIKREIVIDEKASGVQMMSGVSPHAALLGRDLRECYENGHDVIRWLKILYLSDEVDKDSGQRIPKHIYLQRWLDMEKPGKKIWIAQDFKISGVYMRDLTDRQIKELLE